MRRTEERNRRTRRGAVAVEFAMVAPVLIMALFGMSEVTRLCEVKNVLATAVRAGVRLAAMDRDGMVADGQSTNQKVENDIRHFLATTTLPENEVDISISEVGDLDAPFDLDAEANDLRLFQVHIDVPYYAASSYVIPGLGELTLSADIVFRNAQSTLIQ